MRRFIRLSLLSILFVFLVSSLFSQTTYTWNGGDGNWSVDANWSPAGVPGASDEAVISADGTYTVTLDADVSVNILTIGGGTGLQSLFAHTRTLSIGSSANVKPGGRISYWALTLTGTGSLVNEGILSGGAGTFDLAFENKDSCRFIRDNTFNDTVLNHPSGKIVLYSEGKHTFSMTLEKGLMNKGYMHLQSSGYGCSLHINNNSFINDEDASFFVSAYSSRKNYLYGTLDNRGSMILDQYFVVNHPSAVHHNSGDIRLRKDPDAQYAATLELIQSGEGTLFENTGSIVIDSLATLKVTGGSYDFSTGDMNNGGSFFAANAVVTPPAPYLHEGYSNYHTCTLNVPSGLTNLGHLAYWALTLTGTGTLLNESILSGGEGTFDLAFENKDSCRFIRDNVFNDTVVNHPSGKIVLNSSGNSSFSMTLEKGLMNKGSFHLQSSGYGCSIHVNNNTFLNDEDATFFVSAYSSRKNYLYGALDNRGSMILDQYFVVNRSSAVHHNSGSIRLRKDPDAQYAATLELIQNGEGALFENTGSIVLDSLTELKATGGLFNLSTGILENNGSIAINDGTVRVPVERSLKGKLTVRSSTLDCEASLRLTGALNFGVSTFSGDGSLIIGNTLTAYHSVFNCTFQNEGFVKFLEDNTVNGELITLAGSAIRIDSDYGDLTTISKGFINKGLLVIQGGSSTDKLYFKVLDGALVNAPEGRIEFSGITRWIEVSASLENKGNIAVETRIRLMEADNYILNRDSLIVKEAGILESAVAGPFLYNAPDGILGGTGTLNLSNISFSNSGIIAPGESVGTFHVTGNLPMNDTSVIEVELGGSVPGTGHDVLDITGVATLDGSLDVSLVDGFVPAVGDEFEVMNFASSTGDLDTVPGLFIGHGLIMGAEKTSTGIRLLTSAFQNNAPKLEYPIADLELDEDFAPLALADLDTVFIDEDAPLGDVLSYTLTLSEELLTFSLEDNLLSVSPVPDTSGMLYIYLAVEDINGASVSDTVLVTINPVNDPPFVNIPINNLEVDEDFEALTIASLDTIFGDQDVWMGDVLDFSVLASEEILTPSISDGDLIISPVENMNGALSLYVQATDSEDAVVSDTLIVTVNPVNDPPTSFSLLEPAEQEVVASVDAIDFTWSSSSDVDMDPLQYSLHLSRTAWDTTVTALTDTMYSLIPAAPLLYDTEYEYSVKVTDGTVSVNSTESVKFITPEKDVSAIPEDVSKGYFLAQNQPNPFHRETTIAFSIAVPEQLSLKIYNLQGQLIEVLVSGKLQEGVHQVQWSAKNAGSGVYLYRLQAGDFISVKRMIISK